MKVYCYSKCSTCNKALKWLSSQGIEYQVLPIRENPPTAAELRKQLVVQRDLKKLFNTSGKEYRELNIKDQLSTMNESQALDLLASNGNLIKRPFLVDSKRKVYLVGFNQEQWEKQLTN